MDITLPPNLLLRPVTFAYQFENMYAMNIDYVRQEYRICWSGDWRKPPDLGRFPQVDCSITAIRHSREVEEVWAESHVLKCGVDAHIRILNNKEENVFPACKIAIDDRQRRLIKDEFSILCYLASCGSPVVSVHPEPLVDAQGIFGFRMEELFDIKIASRRTYTTTVASVIAKIHQNGVIHFDLSPSNLMKDKEGRLTVIDFGRAGYLGDDIPPDKRRPGSNRATYSTEQDINALKWVLGTLLVEVWWIPTNKIRHLQSKLILSVHIEGLAKMMGRASACFCKLKPILGSRGGAHNLHSWSHSRGKAQTSTVRRDP